MRLDLATLYVKMEMYFINRSLAMAHVHGTAILPELIIRQLVNTEDCVIMKTGTFCVVTYVPLGTSTVALVEETNCFITKQVSSVVHPREKAVLLKAMTITMMP